MEGATTTTGVSTIANMISEPLEGNLSVQADVQERNKRDRECKQSSQGSPRQVKTKRQQGLKRSKPKNGNSSAEQKSLTQYGFGLIAVGGTQWGPMKERQQPLRDEEENNRVRMSEHTAPVALSATSGRESGAEGQDSVEAPRTTTSQDYLVTLGTAAGQRWCNLTVSRTLRHHAKLIWISPEIRSRNLHGP